MSSYEEYQDSNETSWQDGIVQIPDVGKHDQLLKTTSRQLLFIEGMKSSDRDKHRSVVPVDLEQRGFTLGSMGASSLCAQQVTSSEEPHVYVSLMPVESCWVPCDNVPFKAETSCSIKAVDKLDKQLTRSPLRPVQQKCEIFSDAQVVISHQYIEHIPDDKNDFFQRVESVTNVKVEYDEKRNAFILQGTWNQILLSQATLEAYLSTWKEDYFPCDQAVKDKSVTCSADQQPATEPVEKLSETKSTKNFQSRLAHLRLRHRKTMWHNRRKQLKYQMQKSDHLVQRKMNMHDSPSTSVTEDKDRENKENEVYINITVSASESHACEESSKSASKQESSADVNACQLRMKKQRKNYDEITPFKYFCSHCSFKSKRESHYRKHLTLHQRVSTLFSCNKCSFTTIRLGNLRRHEVQHSSTTFSCDICHYRTDDEKFLVRHKRIKHNDRDLGEKTVEVYNCSECEYSSTKLSFLQRHLKVHNSSSYHGSNQPFQCQECNYKTGRKEHYLRHVNNVHNNKRPYLCDFCGKAFKRFDALKQHSIIHADVDPAAVIFHCKVCGKRCRSQAHLNEHLAVHSNIRSFLCEICGAAFKTRSVQRKHVLSIHKNPRSYPCSQCPKKFNTKFSLRRHMKQHSEEEEGAEQSVLREGENQVEVDMFKEEAIILSKNGAELAKNDAFLTAQISAPNEADGSAVQQVEQQAVAMLPVAHIVQDGLAREGDGIAYEQAYIQASEATTALLYLTSTFTPY